MKQLLLFLLLGLALQAKTLTFNEIEAMPSSYAKDYYTWRFIKEKRTTKEEAIKAYLWTKRKNSKLRKAIRKKIGYIPSTSTKKKKKRDPKNYIIYPGTAAKKSKKALKKLYKKIQKQGKYSETLHIMSSNTPFKELPLFPTTTQAYLLNNVGLKYLRKHLNHVMSYEQVNQLVQEPQFNTTINTIVMNRKLEYLKASLLMIEKNSLSFKTNFLLAMNAVKFNQKPLATKFLKIARTKTEYQSHYDQIDFWLYLITKDKKYLKQLIKSHQVNLYTLKARDILNIPYPKVVTPNLGYNNIKDKSFNIENPIDWEKIKIKMKENPEQIDNLAENYKSHATEGVYTYLKEKATNYTVPYYPMPYREAMWGYSKERAAMLYALARQESRFVPASVSPSYALGMMQIMPFLIKHLAKERKEKLDLDKIFNPYTAISYANQHMNYLNKWLYHPLFVAYAYNGGIGFTRGLLRKKYLFRKEGRYEPFLSMEMVNNEEAKEYGKKVLANYVIYLNLLSKNQTRVSSFLNMLVYPSQTDRFRK